MRCGRTPGSCWRSPQGWRRFGPTNPARRTTLTRLVPWADPARGVHRMKRQRRPVMADTPNDHLTYVGRIQCGCESGPTPATSTSSPDSKRSSTLPSVSGGRAPRGGAAVGGQCREVVADLLRPLGYRGGFRGIACPGARLRRQCRDVGGDEVARECRDRSDSPPERRTDNIPSMMHLPGRHRRRGGPDGTLDHPLPRHRLDAVLVHPDRHPRSLDVKPQPSQHGAAMRLFRRSKNVS